MPKKDEQKRDHLAEALNRLSQGDAQDDPDDAGAAPSESIPLDIPAPGARKVPPRPAPPMATPRVVKSASKVAVPKPGVPTSNKARPAIPVRRVDEPESPTAETPEVDLPIEPVSASSARPASPGGDDISSSLANVVDDSELSVSFTAMTSGPRIATQTGPSKSLKVRRTLIPMLLTLGVGLPLIAVWWFTLDTDAPIRQTGKAFPLAMFVVGAVMLALAAVNMISVRSEMTHQSSK